MLRSTMQLTGDGGETMEQGKPSFSIARFAHRLSPLWEYEWRTFKKLKINLPYDSVRPSMAYVQRTKHPTPQILAQRVHCHSTHNS